MIDMRLRPPLPSWKNARLYAIEAFNAMAHPDFPRPYSASSLQMQDLLSEMDAAGVEIGVAMGRQSPGPLGSLPNNELEQLVAQYPDRFIAWAGLDVTLLMDHVLAELERCVKTGAYKGISIEPTLSDAHEHGGDKRLYPLFELALKHDLPVNISLSCALQGGSGQPLDKARPAHLMQAARDFRKLNFHIGHAAWPFTLEAIAVAISNPNIWLSPDMYLVPQFAGAEHYANAARNFLSDRVLFGSAYPFKPLAPTVAAYRSWGFGQQLEQKLFKSNAQRLMKLV